MPKKLLIILLFAFSLVLFTPMKTEALTVSNVKISDSMFILEDPITSTDDIQDWMDDYNQDQDCSGANSILGDPDDEDSVAWLLQLILNYIKILGPILVVVLSSIDFAQVIISNNDDAMKKASKKLAYRLVFAVCLFFIPTLVQVLLDIFGITSDPTCGIH